MTGRLYCHRLLISSWTAIWVKIFGEADDRSFILGITIEGGALSSKVKELPGKRIREDG
jgi:hypothetical protein